MDAAARSRNPFDKLKAVGLLLCGISSFQIGASLAKGLFPFFGPSGTVGLRVCLAALILLAIWRPPPELLKARVLKILLPYGASIAVMNFCFYAALVRLPLGIVVALEFTGPLTLALSGSRHRLDVFWTLLVVAGLFLLLRPESAGTGMTAKTLDPIGVLMALLGGCGWVVYILTGSRTADVMSAGMATTLGITTAGIFLLPCLIPTVPAAVAHPWAGLAALGVAVLSSAVPYILDMMAMRRLTPRDLGVLLSLDPMMGAISGVVFLHEALSLSRWAGVLCIVVASAGNVLTARSARTHCPPPSRPAR